MTLHSIDIVLIIFVLLLTVITTVVKKTISIIITILIIATVESARIDNQHIHPAQRSCSRSPSPYV